jgi:hypothetical protein
MNQPQDALVPVDFGKAFDAMKAREDHRRNCERWAVNAACRGCGTERCPSCGKAHTPRPAESDCPECVEARDRKAALDPVYASIPKRFRWAIDADAATLRQIDAKTNRPRVDLSPAFLTGALERASGGCRMVIGSTGAGKTSFVVAALCAYVRRDWQARKGALFGSAFWLAGDRSRYSLGKGEAPDVEAAMNASLLVLDDLGNDAQDHRNTISEILFKRHEDELPTWVTTGYPVEHLSGRYGPAFIRRIAEEPNSLIEMGKR